LLFGTEQQKPSNCHRVLVGKEGAFAMFQKRLKLTNGADQDKLAALIWCTHFVQFPLDNSSGFSNEEMLAAIKASTPPSKKILSKAEKIDWSAAIIQKGF
jgi:hypothetical protein